jgi:triacylglycerol lipase
VTIQADPSYSGNMTRIILAILLFVQLPALVLASVKSFEKKAPTNLVPVVFVPGIFMNGATMDKWKNLRSYFQERGYELMSAHTLPSSSYEKRAEVLNKEIMRLVPTGQFHILAHSAGGIDSRLGIHKYNWGKRLLSLTTISSPHHGSAVSDYAALLIHKYTGDNPVTDFFFRVYAKEIEIAKDMTTDHMKAFNEIVKDDPRVGYFSVGGYSLPPVAKKVVIPLLWWGFDINKNQGFPVNDGLVTPDSAKWGKYLGSWESDHASIFLDVKYAGKKVYPAVYKVILDNLDQHYPH